MSKNLFYEELENECKTNSIEKRCNNMLTIIFYCKDGNTFSIKCEDIEEHKMTDEIYLYKNNHVNAKINTLAIAAYEIVESEEQESVLDKIRAEILDEAEYAYADFDRYKEDILHAESDELPDDDFRYGLERAVEIINKYKSESEEQK